MVRWVFSVWLIVIIGDLGELGCFVMIEISLLLWCCWDVMVMDLVCCVSKMVVWML